MGVAITDDEENMSTEDFHGSSVFNSDFGSSVTLSLSRTMIANSGTSSFLARNSIDSRSTFLSAFNSGSDLERRGLGKQTHLQQVSQLALERKPGEGGGIGAAIASALGIERVTSSASLNRGNFLPSSFLTLNFNSCNNILLSGGNNSGYSHSFRASSSARFPFRNVSSSLRSTFNGSLSGLGSASSSPPTTRCSAVLAAAVTGTGPTTSTLFSSLSMLSSSKNSCETSFRVVYFNFLYIYLL